MSTNPVRKSISAGHSESMSNELPSDDEWAHTKAAQAYARRVELAVKYLADEARRGPIGGSR